MDLRLSGSELGQDAPEPQRVFTEAGAHPVVARGGGIAFVEDQVDHPEHRGQARGQLLSARHLEGDARLGQGALGADDALGDGRVRDQEGPRDLLGGEAAEEAQGEGHPRLHREDRMAGREHEAQEVVADVVVDGRLEIGGGHGLPGLELAADLLVFALDDLAGRSQSGSSSRWP